MLCVCEASAFEPESPMLPHVKKAGWDYQYYRGERTRPGSQDPHYAPALVIGVRTASQEYYADHGKNPDFAGQVKVIKKQTIWGDELIEAADYANSWAVTSLICEVTFPTTST